MGMIEHDLNKQRERVIVAGVDLPIRFGDTNGGDCDLDELERLVDTAGGKVLGEVRQRRDRPAPSTLIGKGKLEELQAVVKETEATLVVFDNELSPAQGRNLEKALNGGENRPNHPGDKGKVSVIDRTELILDIFANHARTRQARLQVELAQIQYMLPRLTKLWSHLERQAGGIGTRGPGETQLETDRRLVGKRLAKLKKDLQHVAADREVQSRRRREQYTAALVGYTNAGKSTLLRALTGADVLVQNKLFATLDTTTRRIELDERRRLMLSDTVGFIKRLPHHLVESFQATLAEVAEADLLVHVVDASDDNPELQIASVNEVLADLVPEDRDTLMVFNKIDMLDPERAETVRNRFTRLFPGSLVVSALDDAGVEEVRDALESRLLAREQIVTIEVPYTRMDLVAVFHRTGSVLEEKHTESGVVLDVRLKEEELSRLAGGDDDVKVVE
jgi:GTP-binding protein HflX